MKNALNITPEQLILEKAKLKAMRGNFYEDEEREKLIKVELRKLKKMTSMLNTDRKNLVKPLLENIAFAIVQLAELREIIKRDGQFTFYQNGIHQWGLKKSIANEMIGVVGKTYAKYLDQLHKFLPTEYDQEDPFVKFNKNHQL